MNNNQLGENNLLDIEEYTSQVGMDQDFELPFYYNLGSMFKLEGTFLFFAIILAVLSYAFLAVSLQKIARRLRASDDWYAWVPVLNLVLLLKIVKKPQSLIFLFFIPIVGFFFTMIVWMEIAVMLGKSKWLGILVAIPVVNVFVILYLAYSGNSMCKHDSNITTIKSINGAFAYNSKIIEEKKISSNKNEEQATNLSQLERDLQELEKEPSEIHKKEDGCN